MKSITIQAKTKQTKSSFCSTLLTVYVVRHCKLNSLRLAVINELFCLYVTSRSGDCVYDCFLNYASEGQICLRLCVCVFHEVCICEIINGSDRDGMRY